MENFRPGRQEERDTLAKSVREIRKERDEKRTESKKWRSKLRGLLQRPGGSSELATSADKKHVEANSLLRKQQRNIQEKDSEWKELQFRSQYKNGVEALDTIANYWQEPPAEWSQALSTLRSSTEAFVEAMNRPHARYGHDPSAEGWTSRLETAFDRFAHRPETDDYRTESINEARNLMLGLIENHLPQLMNKLKEQDTPTKAGAISTLRVLAKFGTPEQTQTTLAVLEQHFDLAKEWTQSPSTAAYEGLAELYVDKGTDIQKEQSYSAFEKLFEDAKIRETIMPRFVQSVCADSWKQNRALGDEQIRYLQKLIGSSGLDPRTMWEAWYYANPNGSHHAVERSVRTMWKLEERMPGAAKKLNEEYGIAVFGRYPAELLLAQLQEQHKNDLPYGVMVYPYDDHNGAWLQNNFVLKDLHEQLQNHYYLRVFECGSKQDIARTLITLDKTYGDQHKISFAILGGHGTKDSITIGGEWKRGVLRTTDLSGKGIARTGSFFEDQPTIMLESCSTGKDTGIAQQLSDTLGATVIAPEEDTITDHYTVTYDNAGRAQFQVTYGDVDIDRSYSRGLPHATSTAAK